MKRGVGPCGPGVVGGSHRREMRHMLTRLAYACTALLLVNGLTATAAGPRAPSADELSRAAWVVEALAERRLSEDQWLFSQGRHFAWGFEGRPSCFVGWWRVFPETHGVAAVPMDRPSPVNAECLEDGKRFLVLAEEDFHLLLVYPVGDSGGDYVQGMNRSEFERRVWDASLARETVEWFLDSLSEGRSHLAVARRYLSDARQEEYDARGEGEQYLRDMGVLDLRSPWIEMEVQLAEEEARVRVFASLSGATGAEYQWRTGTFVLTPAPRIMGPRSWAIADYLPGLPAKSGEIDYFHYGPVNQFRGRR